MEREATAEAPSVKVVGRRSPDGRSLEDADRLLRTAWALRGDEALVPTGVYRFRSFEEADEWMTRMIARTSARRRSTTSLASAPL